MEEEREEPMEDERGHVAFACSIQGTGTVTMPTVPASQQTEDEGGDPSPDKE